jgi:kynurenine formamidase
MSFDDFTIVDLSHSLHPGVPTWDDSCGFRLQMGKSDDENDVITMHTSTGTHIDAPSHSLEGKITVDSLPLTQLLGPAYVIDVSDRAIADYAISLADIQNYEATYGPIAENGIVIGYTGWSRYWSDTARYRSVEARGDTHFPVFSTSAIKYLLERKIAGIAIDTFSPDPIRSSNCIFPNHDLLFKAGKYIIENLTNVDLLPPRGSYIIALPMKIQKGGEAPARVIALIPKK